MSGVTGGRRDTRTTARIEAPTKSRKRSATATPRTYGTAPALDPSARTSSLVLHLSWTPGDLLPLNLSESPQSCPPQRPRGCLLSMCRRSVSPTEAALARARAFPLA